MADPVDAAIAATEAPPTVRLNQYRLTLASGKPIVLALPDDMTAFDALCIQRAVLDIYDQQQQAKAQQPASRLLVPAGARLRPSCDSDLDDMDAHYVRIEP